MLNIIEGKMNRPVKTVIYGAEGIGKSTLASQFPKPLFIDTEGGTSQLDIRRIGKPSDWHELIDIINEVAATPDICETLVIDTADWAEILCTLHICKKYKQSSVESFGYGKGYTYLAEEWQRLLTACNKVITSGKHVVITAHAKMRKFEQPDEAGAYDRWEMKLSKQVAPLLKEWCDLLLFCNYKTFVVTTDTNAKKAQGGKRVMYTSHHPCWDAKNRYGLPDELELSFDSIKHLFESPLLVDKLQLVPMPGIEKLADAKAEVVMNSKDTPLDKLHNLMLAYGITDAELQRVVAAKGHYSEDTPIDQYEDKFINGWLLKYWAKIVKLINEN